MQGEILRLKKEKNICILGHAYQGREILEVADYVGDSFGLSLRAAESDADGFIMCGVRFMAETVKLLAPRRRVWLANEAAGCPMAEQMDTALVSALRETLPGYTVAAYINTTAELKTVCDVCVTSSSAVRILRRVENDKIIFIPDQNLGDWIARQIPEKTFHLVSGGCPTHVRITLRDLRAAREAHPEALLLVHPECRPEVTAEADFVGSTTEIMAYAGESDADTYIIGTENSIAQHLAYEFPQKSFVPLSKDCVCHNMSITALPDLYRCLLGAGGEEIILPEGILRAARRPIDEMIRLGK